jgi:vacuolar-type H+-ATPase subunit F/Vma7
MKILIITFPSMAVGYRLAGTEVLEVREDDNFTEILNSVLKIDDLGILCVEESILNDVPEPFMRRIGKLAMPLIVPITTPATWKGRKEGESYITRLIRRAIGYQIKIKG